MKKQLLLGLFLFMGVAGALKATAQNLYVKPNGTGDGSSWNNATSLSEALQTNLADGDVIHLAAGTYQPGYTIEGGDAMDDNELTFEIDKNIQLIGGYSENPMNNEQPNPEVNLAVLSGLLDNGIKVNHVVSITAPKEDNKSVELSGVVITDGNADGSGTTIAANGITYPKNHAGGIIVANARVVLNNCSVTGNMASSHGVGMYVFENAEILVTNSIVSENEGSTSNGAGMYLKGATATFENSTFENNTTDGVAGAIQTYASSTLYMYNCTIANNVAGVNGSTGRRAGGLYNRDGSNAKLVNCTIYGNSATGYGGGIHTHANAIVDVISSTITANSGIGGGINNTDGCTINLYNSIVSGNFEEGSDSNIIGTVTLQSSIQENAIYDENGNEVPSLNFDVTEMLGALTSNGGATQTCQLLGSGNPALNNGMTVSELQTLGATFSPVLSNDFLSKDQIGNDRTSNSMGALSNSATLSIDSNSLQNRFNVYPNPVTQGYVLIADKENEVASVVLFDVLGNQVLKTDNLINNVLDVSRLNSGMYLLTISSGKLTETKKLIIK